ncbi:hypothetical protein ACRYCC_31045 [Actinomadura scrupuli]|uniref:hypothetical protein n=1 Tax=Actinomadura scrupuli TaxID=559629 RepID=UPI003D98A785
MVQQLLRLAAELGPAAGWALMSIMVIITAFTLYVGIAMVATLRSNDPDQAKIRYKVFADLLTLFRRAR